jgi:hypothetical protein
MARFQYVVNVPPVLVIIRLTSDVTRKTAFYDVRTFGVLFRVGRWYIKRVGR